MRKRVYLLCCLLLGIGIASSALAQGNGGSRLNITKKEKPTALKKSPLSYSPYKVNNQPLILQKPAALSTYYRTLLFGNSGEISSPEESKEIEPVLVNVPQNTVSKPVNFENSNQENENLYVSDRITVKNLYPNPANEFALLQYSIGDDVKNAKMALYNVLGATVKEYSLNRQSQQLNVDTRNLPNGVYFYQLTVDGQKVATKKLLVRHH